MTSDSATVGLAVGIPCGVIAALLLLIWWRTTTRIKKEEKSDAAEPDIEADLTFDNYEELAGPNVVIKTEGGQQQQRSKSKKYRTYSHHPSMKRPNNIRLQQLAAKDSLGHETDYSLLGTAVSGSTNTNLTNNTSTTHADLPKQNSEHLLQNYFEGVIPVVPTPKNGSEINSTNSSHINLAPPSQPVVDAESHISDGSAGHTPVNSMLFNHSNSFVGMNGKGLPAKSKSLFRKRNNSANISVSDSSDSLSQQYYIKSLNKNALESNDFTMPIPGNNRTSMVYEHKLSLTELAARDEKVLPPRYKNDAGFFIDSSANSINGSDTEAHTLNLAAGPDTALNDNPFEFK